MWSCWARPELLAALKRVVKGLAPVMTLEMSALAPRAPEVRPPKAVSKRFAFWRASASLSAAVRRPLTEVPVPVPVRAMAPPVPTAY